MGKSAILFPGQGAQTVGMGADFVAGSPSAKAIFEQADEVLGFALSAVCFEGPAEELERTDIQQPAIFTTGAAIWAALLEAGGSLEQFSHAAGLSLGEYTALYAAGAMDFATALKLVRRRGKLMQEAAMAQPSGMVTLVGADEAMAERICAEACEDEVLVAANYNCPGQIVLAGHRGACERALSAAEQHSIRAIPLAVAGAFHSPLMQPAADAFEAVLAAAPMTAPKIPVASNVDASFHREPDGIRKMLVRQLTSPVRWQRCMETLVGSGVDRFVEIGPGRVLTGLMRKIDRRANMVNVSSPDALRSALPVESAG